MAINTVMDHGGPDPIQGFDVDVWVQDASRANAGTLGSLTTNSNMVLLGSFTSIVITIRNATEAYMELNQRMPRYLDGEVQIAFVMEKGFLDMYQLRQSFGFDKMRRNKRFNRSPRFTVTFNSNTYGELNDNVFTPNVQYMQSMQRQSSGRYLLHNCKVDSWHFAATAGKQVVASQWQGVSEGIEFLSAPASIDSMTGADTNVAFNLGSGSTNQDPNASLAG